MFGDFISLDQALVVCIFSLAVAFAVLLALAGIVSLTTRIVSHFGEE